MTASQPGILHPLPALSRYLEFSLLPNEDPTDPLRQLSTRIDADDVVGLGPDLYSGVQPFPGFDGPAVSVPATQRSLWCWLRGNDRGVLLHRSRQIMEWLRPAFRCELRVDGFVYDGGRDLTGYEDGTENPEGKAAWTTAISGGTDDGPVGGSFVAVQQWVHDLHYFETLPQEERDHIIGRRRSDNEELDDAPDTAHVKRTAQESFEPEAFLLRRSMPWADSGGEGLMFVAFGHDLYAFDAIVRRMVGLEDGITDAMFRFTRPITGGYYWCPPVRDGRLDLSALQG